MLVLISNLPIVSVGTLVTFFVVPSVNCKVSVAAGVVRVGLQFVLTAHEALLAPIQVYVVCPSKEILQKKVRGMKKRKKNSNFILKY